LAFEEVIERRRIGRNLADEAYLGLARTAKQQQDLATAERVYSRLRVSGVLKYRPLAELYLGVLRKDQQRYDEAVALNRSAYAAFKAAGEELGMRLADGDLAVIEMKRGDYGKARGILEGLVDEHMKILDTNAAGLAYNNLAAACAELPDLPAARDAYLRGLSCHAAAGRKRLMAGTYSNLGTTLSKLGEIETAFAAFDRAVELAERVGSADLGLRVRRAELEAILRHRTRLARVPTLAARCDEIIKKWGHEISNEAFREYTTTLFQVLGAGMGTGSGERAAGETPAPLGREAGSRLDELTGETTDSHYRELLTERLGDGMHRRSAPPVSDLRDFLLLFMGDYLRFHDYVGEFFISPSRGKLQLRELCQRRILAVTGTRRAGKYSLAFHRT
jgi:tetratricopeptide (TPR) repeat protein